MSSLIKVMGSSVFYRLKNTVGMLVVSCRDPPEMVLAESVRGRSSGRSMLATIAGECGARETKGETGVRDMAAEAVGSCANVSREGIR